MLRTAIESAEGVAEKRSFVVEGETSPFKFAIIQPMKIVDILNSKKVSLSFEVFPPKKTDAIDLRRADLVTYSHGHYYSLGEKIGKFGFSVEKRK